MSLLAAGLCQAAPGEGLTCESSFPIRLSAGMCVSFDNPCTRNGAWLSKDGFSIAAANDPYTIKTQPAAGGNASRQLCATSAAPPAEDYIPYAYQGPAETSGTGNLIVTVLPRSAFPVTVTADHSAVAPGKAVRLKAVPGGGTAPHTYVWTPDAALEEAGTATPVVHPARKTDYSVVVTDAAGAKASGKITISVDVDVYFHVVSADGISPAGGAKITVKGGSDQAALCDGSTDGRGIFLCPGLAEGERITACATPAGAQSGYCQDFSVATLDIPERPRMQELLLSIKSRPNTASTASLSGADSLGKEEKSRTFTWTTGYEQNFTVPWSVTSLHIVAEGGDGGSHQGQYNGSQHYNADDFGRGAFVIADLPVTPGQILNVEAGGKGTILFPAINRGYYLKHFHGGMGGGGVWYGGSGGNPSMVTDPQHKHIYVAAGGGGGQGGGSGVTGMNSGEIIGGIGGDGGSLPALLPSSPCNAVNLAGVPVCASGGIGTDGGGGTPTGLSGTPFGIGTSGQDGYTKYNDFIESGAGGGGGGGYPFGGFGGRTTCDNCGGDGGGAGYSYIDPSTTSGYFLPPVHSTVKNNFNGYVTITWLQVPTLKQSTLSASNSHPALGDSVTFTATFPPNNATDPIPTGTVWLFDRTTGNLLGTGQLDISGIASFSSAGLPVGTHRIYASYEGDSHYMPLNTNIVGVSVVKKVAMRLTSDFPGSKVTVDGQKYTTPVDVMVVPGSAHSITAASPISISAQTRMAFASWTDGGAQTHAITAGSTDFSLAAHYAKQYLVTVKTNPAAGGSATGGGWYGAGATASIQAVPAAGYAFSKFGGYINTTANPASVKVEVPLSVLANFTALPVTAHLASSYPGTHVIFDGTDYKTPADVTVKAGSSHTITAVSPLDTGVGSRVAFQSWANGGTQTKTFTADLADFTITSNYVKQYFVTVKTNPAAGGSVTGGGWYDAGATASVQAIPAAGYAFSKFGGYINTTANPASVKVEVPLSVLANFTALPAQAIRPASP